MTTNIIRASSKRKSGIILLTAVLIAISGCQNNLKPPAVKEMSQLEWRQLQTRTFTTQDTKGVLKALISAMQDEGYVIQTANTELGLITAVKEISDVDKDDKAFQEFWYGRAIGYQTSRSIEVSSTVNTKGSETSVRVNITQKGKSDVGGTMWSQPVDDPRAYQGIFSRIDKSMFLESNT